MKPIDLRQGDCLEIMKDIADKSIDMILCDLPYGTTACKWDNVIPFEPLWKQFNRIIKDNGCIALFGSEPFASKLRMSNLRNYRYDWVWHKNTSGSFATAKKMPMKYHENILIFYNKQPNYNPQFQQYSDKVIKRFKDGERVNRKKQVNFSSNKIHNGLSFLGEQSIMLARGKYPESVQKFNNIAQNKRLHPTQKPVELLEYLIKTYTNEGETVLDNCMGSGSTGVACVNTNRNFVGIELDIECFEMAKTRIQNAQAGFKGGESEKTERNDRTTTTNKQD